MLSYLSANAGGLAARPSVGFRADDGKDPVEYANQAADRLRDAHYGKPGLNISEAHNALSHLGTG